MSSTKKRWIVGLAIVGVSVVAVALGKHSPRLSGDAPAYRQLGSARARVVITEYSDFQCPKCAKAAPTVKELLNAYPREVRLVFHHYPLNQHAWSVLSARAAESAGLQGKFWEYADILFAKQTEWSELPDPKPAFLDYAKTLGMNVDQFAKDLDGAFVADIVKKDKAQAETMDVPATPTFFINQRMLVGDVQLAGNGARYVEQELGR